MVLALLVPALEHHGVCIFVGEVLLEAESKQSTFFFVSTDQDGPDQLLSAAVMGIVCVDV